MIKSTNITDVTTRAGTLASEYSRADGEIWGLVTQLQLPSTPRQRRRLIYEVQLVLNRLGEKRDPQTAGLIKLAYSRGVHLVEPDDKVKTTPAVDVFIQSLRNRLTSAESTVASNLRDAVRRITLASAARALEESERLHPTLPDMLAPTGYTDRSGSKWSLGRYAGMVIRTVAHETLSEGTLAAMRSHGYDLVKVSSEKSHTPACESFDGKVFSLSPDNPDYPPLKSLPPFHPDCNHFIYRYAGS